MPDIDTDGFYLLNDVDMPEPGKEPFRAEEEEGEDGCHSDYFPPGYFATGIMEKSLQGVGGKGADG